MSALSILSLNHHYYKVNCTLDINSRININAIAEKNADYLYKLGKNKKLFYSGLDKDTKNRYIHIKHKTINIFYKNLLDSITGLNISEFNKSMLISKIKSDNQIKNYSYVSLSDIKEVITDLLIENNSDLLKNNNCRKTNEILSIYPFVDKAHTFTDAELRSVKKGLFKPISFNPNVVMCIINNETRYTLDPHILNYTFCSTSKARSGYPLSTAQGLGQQTISSFYDLVRSGVIPLLSFSERHKYDRSDNADIKKIFYLFNGQPLIQIETMIAHLNYLYHKNNNSLDIAIKKYDAYNDKYLTTFKQCYNCLNKNPFDETCLDID